MIWSQPIYSRSKKHKHDLNFTFFHLPDEIEYFIIFWPTLIYKIDLALLFYHCIVTECFLLFDLFVFNVHVYFLLWIIPSSNLEIII